MARCDGGSGTTWTEESRPSSRSRRKQATARAFHARNQARLGVVRELGNDAVRAVPFPYLCQPVMHGDRLSARICRHVTVGKRIVEGRGWRGKLAAQLASETAFLGFEDRAGVMRDQAAQDRV